MNYLNYAASDREAESRFRRYRNIDPFDTIESALLNTADIADYVNATGMIYPFNHNKLKPASYEMDLGGEVLCWDENDKEKWSKPSIGTEIKLRRNSITFVTVNAKFRLPDYIAMRFNLQIEHVHKGILLGTGPLINPGFTGKLMIPLHNLTNNDYVIKSGEPLIGVEFTKLSSNNSWKRRPQQAQGLMRLGQYQPNTQVKSDKDFHQYISMFIPRGMIVKSSLSGTLDKAERSASKAERRIKQIYGFGIISVIGLIIALFALAYQVIGVVTDANNYVASSSNKINDLRKENEKLRNYLEDHIDKIEKNVPTLKR